MRGRLLYGRKPNAQAVVVQISAPEPAAAKIVLLFSLISGTKPLHHFANAPIAAVVAFAVLVTGGCGGGGGARNTTPPLPPTNESLDIAGLATGNGFLRVSGSASTGRFGVPVAGGVDCDGDGNADFAMSGMQASPLGRDRAGQVSLIFGNGQIEQNFDTAQANANVLVIAGAGAQEATGGEIWMDDVTGDGLGDLIIGRPNFRAALPDRIGAGALTIVVGGQGLRDLASNNVLLDLASPPPTVSVLTVSGAAALDRLGFWMRTGDVSGDGIADIVVGADQEDLAGETNRGAVYLLRGGAHLDSNLFADLQDFGATALAGHLLKILPPSGSGGYHFGATVAVSDIDDNGRADIMIAASLKRVGGELLAEDAPAGSAIAIGSNPGGSLFIVWDDNISAASTWAPGLAIATDSAPASTTRIDGGSVAGVFSSHSFAEEMLGGGDYDGDGDADLFLGDIWGIARTNRDRAGVGHLFFAATNLKNRSFSVSDVPGDLVVTTILGPATGTISNDTSAYGDFDGDGIDDLAIASPLASPFGRTHAGTIHVLWGKNAAWPTVIDLEAGSRPGPDTFAITDIFGANGERSAADTGDTLMYSAAAADMDGDGRADLIVNEMRGNGIGAAALDVGNLLIIAGGRVPK